MLDTRTPEIDELLTRGVTYVIEEDHLKKRLENGEKLRVKFGVDPTGPKIHIGRAVPLWKLRAFQDLGHTIVMLIGDFTAQIGDASDKTAERPMLSKEEVQENLKGYMEQIGMFLDMSKTEVVYNSDWLSTLDFAEISQLADSFSVAEMLDRDNFAKRYQSNERISLREFMYPLMQGYDSVAVKSDLEVGGNDQYFNLMAGRTIQKNYGQEPQDIMTFEFLVGLDGRKMSTSWGNGIFIVDEPQDMFGKIMTLNDDLIETYFRLATDLPLDTIAEYVQQLQDGANPRDIKLQLAKEIVRRYRGEEVANSALNNFKKVFSDKFIQEKHFKESGVVVKKSENKNVLEVMSEVFSISKSEVRRVFKEGGFKIYNAHNLREQRTLSEKDMMETLSPQQFREFTTDNTEKDGKVLYYVQKGKKHFVKFSYYCN